MSFIPLRLFLCLLWASFVPFVVTVFAANGTYTNPIIDADYSDPDVIRVGDDFYLTASSFNCIPGLPIANSRSGIKSILMIPKLYKRNGYYYIFAPAGGMDRSEGRFICSRL